MFPISKPSSTKRITSFRAHWINPVPGLILLFNQLVECKVSLNSIHQCIDEGQIWPDQIEDAILTFREIQTTTEKIPSVLSMENQPYLTNKAYRYQIIVNSEFLNSQINEAINMIRGLEARNKSTNKAIQKNVKHIFAQIQSNLDCLLDDLDQARA